MNIMLYTLTRSVDGKDDGQLEKVVQALKRLAEGKEEDEIECRMHAWCMQVAQEMHCDFRLDDEGGLIFDFVGTSSDPPKTGWIKEVEE